MTLSLFQKNIELLSSQLQHTIQWLQKLIGTSNPNPELATISTNDSNKPQYQFQLLWETLSDMVESGDREGSEALLKHVQQSFPLPVICIERKEHWPMLVSDMLVIRSHGNMDVSQAIQNTNWAGKTLTESEKVQLRKVMNHFTGWSPTPSSHRDQSWIRFLRFYYPQLKDLQPILDSVVIPYEANQFPSGLIPMPPWLCLLATASCYYVYNLEKCSMMEAGKSMSEVLDGMERELYHCSGKWPRLPHINVPVDPRDYFPIYDWSFDDPPKCMLVTEGKEIPMEQLRETNESQAKLTSI